jgi:hypothetical protein
MFGGTIVGGRPRWVDAVAGLDAIVGAALVVAGVYLIEPGRLDLGFYLEAERYRLAGGAFIYAGLVLGYAGVFGSAAPRTGFIAQLAGAVFGTPGLFWCAAISLGLAARAALAGWSPEPVVLIAIPGVLASLSLRFAAIAKSWAADPPAAITADSGKRPPFVLWRFLWRGATFAIALTTSISVMGVALYALVLLDAAFIGGRSIDLGYAWQVIGRNLVPLVAALGGTVFGVIGLGGIASAIGDRARRRREADFGRDLSAEEVSFATRYVSEIRGHVARHGLAEAARRASRAAWWTFAASGVGGIVLALEADRIVAATYAPGGDAWRFYLVAWPGTSVAALAAMLSFAFVPRAIAKLLSRRAAEACGVRLIRADGGVGALEAQVVARVRDRSLAPGTTLGAGALLRTLGVTTAVFVLVWNALLAAGVAAWWPHERARDALYTEGGIETGGFWSLERKSHPYASVEAVFLKCQTFAIGGAAIGYTIVLPGFVQRELVTRHRLVTNLEETLMVDAKLREAGVPFVFALPEEAPAGTDIVDRMCIVALTDGMDEAMRSKVEQVFHLDEWFERRWRLRTGAHPRIVVN